VRVCRSHEIRTAHISAYILSLFHRNFPLQCSGVYRFSCLQKVFWSLLSRIVYGKIKFALAWDTCNVVVGRKVKFLLGILAVIFLYYTVSGHSLGL